MTTYKVIREIARGGSGIVQEIQDASGGRFARKIFNEDGLSAYSPKERHAFARRFDREVRIQQQIHHPNVLTILETHLEDGAPWFVMPLARRSLADVLATGRPGLDEAVPWLLDVLAGLEELHRLGYVHRDLKPANVLFLGDRWAVADLGLILPLSRDTTSVTSSTAGGIGSSLFMAPEQVTDFKRVTSAADIYAFGCILRDIVDSSPRIPFYQQTAPGLVGKVVERCTAMRATDRFADVVGLRSALSFCVAENGEESVEADHFDLANRLRFNCTSLTVSEWDTIVAEAAVGSDPGRFYMGRCDLSQLDALRDAAPSQYATMCQAIATYVCSDALSAVRADTFANRLKHIFERGSVDQQAMAALATLRVGCDHQRPYVMSTFLQMVSRGASADFADRLAIEIIAGSQELLGDFRQIFNRFGDAAATTHTTILNALARRGIS